MLTLFRPNVKKLEAEGNVEGLIRALQYSDINEPWAHEAAHKVRESAAEALSKIGQSSVEPLIVALKDESVRQAAAEALVKIGQSSVEPLIVALKDQNVRQAAVEALSKIGQPSVEPLIAALRDKDKDVRSAADEALGKIGWQPDRSLSGAKYWIAKKNWTQCINLGELAVEPLIASLKDQSNDCVIAALKDQSVRQAAAVEALVKIGQPSVKPLIATLKDQSDGWANVYARVAAVSVLGRIGGVPAVEPLIAALKDRSHYVRKEAISASGNIGDARAVEPLIVALKDHDVWCSTVEALVKIGRPSVEPLIAVLKDQDKYVRQRAAEALGKIGGLSPEQEQVLAEQKALAEQEALAEQKVLEEKKQKEQEQRIKKQDMVRDPVVELLNFPPSPAEANPRLRHVVDEITRLAPGRAVIVGGWDKTLAQQLKTSFAGQYQFYVNDSCSLGWLRQTVEAIRASGQKAILMSNFPRDTSSSPGLNVCHEADGSTSVAVFFWGTYAVGYYESVMRGLARGGHLVLAQLLVDAERDSDLLTDERKKLTACTDKSECQAILRGILQSLEGDTNCPVANYGGVLMP